MRIGLVTGEYPPMEGGVGAFTEQLARTLADQGHDIDIITSKKARPADIPRRASALLEPIELDFARLHPRAGRWRWPTLSTIADIAIRHDLEIINLQYQAAAFNMHSPAIHFLPWRLKSVVPTVVTFHDLRVPYLFPKAGRLREVAIRGLARRAAGNIATNTADMRTLHSWTARPARQIPIGSNIDVYKPNHIEIAEVREKLGLGNNDTLLGYFGFLNETKGADTLIQALAELDQQYHLVFIGGQTGSSDPGNNQEFLSLLQDQIEQLNLSERVHWTGFLSSVRVSAHLAAADIMVMPYRDGVSLRRGTLMAVLAHGRPLITTFPAEATTEFTQGKNMMFVSPDNPSELTHAIAQLAGDDSLRERLGQEARELGLQFDWTTIAAKTAEFYAELIKGDF
jgi:glycosyltransferase involved in cell wall biosynthesis